jgi:hypothetical protein
MLGNAQAQSPVDPFDSTFDALEQDKLTAALPAPPRDADLVRFELSTDNRNHHYLDLRSVSFTPIGARFTVVVETPAGLRSSSYIGMSCKSRERRVYAIGRRDGSWSRSHDSRWRYIEENAYNRQYAALYKEVICGDKPPRDLEQLRTRLRSAGCALIDTNCGRIRR